jgi:Tol biopolymer transport system component
MKQLFIVIQLLMIVGFNLNGQNTGVFNISEDIGNPALKGKAVYDNAQQEYTVTGSGYNIWFGRDEFRFLGNKIAGDFILTASFAFEGEGKNAHRKTGWMIRKTVDDNSPHISAVIHGDGLTVMQWRVLKGAYMRDPEDEIFAPKKKYSVLQLERVGDVFIMRAAIAGEPLQVIGKQKLESLEGEVMAGLFVCSHDETVTETARIWNVRIDKPMPASSNSYSGEVALSRLETLSINTFRRNVVLASDKKFEAPNWMPDGKRLLFNMEGLLYTIPAGGGDLEKLNTGSATRNNNDHGISFDGKMLAISSHREGMPGGGSSVYVLPLQGGEPKLVTENTPSYWHGWSADGKEVVYVAQRGDNPVYNIYKKNIAGGKEIQLTDCKPGEHVDGCEYSPDGKFIWFNASFSGTMQLWRMKPDGTGREQITFDEYNNWFPHISPDGKWIAYLSFPSDIEPNSHPAYKRVTLRLMPAAGGAPRTMVYLYGGQGTINVPSWSPDSRNISFVSYTGK